MDALDPCSHTLDAHNQRKVGLLSYFGDALERERLVAHQATFSCPGAMLTAQAQLELRGFSTEVVPPAQGRDWALLFARTDALHPEAISQVTQEIVAIVSAQGGEYLGLTTFLLSKP